MMKKEIKKFWNFLWHSNSIWSWVLLIVLSYVLIKFIFFPTLGLIVGSKMPLVVIESCSMYHKGDIFSNFKSWWESHQTWYHQNGITMENFSNFDYKNGLNKGDILLIIRDKNLELGDIIVFEAGQQHPIIHRVVKLNPLETKGDNNPNQLSGGIEQNIKEEQIIGKAVLRIPKLGWFKLIFYEPFWPKSKRGLCHDYKER